MDDNTIAAASELLLHDLLMGGSWSEEETLMIIDEHPDLLKHQDSQGKFPIHIECSSQCRSHIILKCIEIYPESLSAADKWVFAFT
jgi:hypothetical protein